MVLKAAKSSSDLYVPNMLSHPRRSQGFTLIEIMVVITIAAILVGVVVVNIDFRNPGKTVDNTTRRTSLLMHLTSDQAVYARQQFGMRFHPTSYTFFILSSADDGSQTWEVFADERLKFEQPDLPVEFQVDIDGIPIVLTELAEELDEATEEDPIKPHLLFLSNGDIVPDFRILISDERAEHQQAIFAGEVQPIEVEVLE